MTSKFTRITAGSAIAAGILAGMIGVGGTAAAAAAPPQSGSSVCTAFHIPVTGSRLNPLTRAGQIRAAETVPARSPDFTCLGK